MKIKIGYEPPSGSPNHVMYSVIKDLVNTSDIVAAIQKWTPLPFDYMIELMDWIDVLNQFDLIMEEVLAKWKNQLVLYDDNTVSTQESETMTNPGEIRKDIETVRSILHFSTALLKVSVNKEIYNSSEVRNDLYPFRILD
jgi:hypothetical protein